MRIARYVINGSTHFGIVELAADGTDHPDSIAVITGDPLAGPVKYTGERHPLAEARLLSPVIPRSKVIGLGRNFGDDGQPVSFLKPNTSVIGPGEAIVYPAESREVCFEGELAVVIGRVCRRVPRERVQEVIFGYTCANDVTARDLTAADGQWTRGKSYDTFCPLGPWLSTHLSVAEAGTLSLRTRVNGELRQDATTAGLTHDIADLVVELSQYMTLLPGDVILTGTPAGTGPLEPGDEVSVEIDDIGTLSNPVVAEGDDAGAEGGA